MNEFSEETFAKLEGADSHNGLFILAVILAFILFATLLGFVLVYRRKYHKEKNPDLPTVV